MKGISAVIATILILMIVIALAGMMYLYTIGMFIARTSKTIDVTDAGCRANQTSGYYVSVKNLDTNTTIPNSDLTARVDGTSGTLTCTPNPIPAMGTANCDIAITGATAGSFHRIKVIGPANSAEEPATC